MAISAASRCSGRRALRSFLFGCSCFIGLPAAHADDANQAIPADTSKPAAANSSQKKPATVVQQKPADADLKTAANTSQQAAANTDQPASSSTSQAGATNLATEQVVVSATKFNTTSVSSVNKMPELVIDTSQSIKAFSSDELSFAGVATLSDLGKLDSGEYTTPVGSAYVTQNYFRGFGGANTCNDFPIKVDGFRTNCEMPPDLSPFGSVDILKGSSSSVYGQSFVAGTLVLNSKQPEKEFGGTLTTEFGQFFHEMGQADVHGSLTSDQDLYGRLIVNYTNQGAGFEGFKQDYLTVAPSLKYELTDRDTLTWLASFTYLDNGAGFGFPLAFNASGPGGASNGANYSIPAISQKQLGFLQPPWASQQGAWFNTSLRYEHVFDNNWHLSIATEHYSANYTDKFVWVGDFSPISSNKNSTTDLYIYYEKERDNQYAAEVNLFGDIEVLGHKQTIFVGGDYTESILGVTPYVGKYISGSGTGFNIYDPNWSLVPDPASPASFQTGGLDAPATFAVGYKRYEVNAGPEVGALLRPIDNLVINLGARWTADTETIRRVCCSLPLNSLSSTPTTSVRPAQDHWTYQAGANYAILDKLLHVYVSYGTTFEAANKFAFNPSDPTGVGTFLGPQKGASAEFGFKGETDDETINYSIDIFDTRITNAFQTDPQHQQYFISVGAERARGLEAEFQGKILPEWNVTASVSTTENIYTSGPLQGFSSPFAVPFGLSIYSDYEFLDGPLEGFGFGGGYVLKTRAPYKLYNGADLSGLIKDDSEASARLFYDFEPWRIDLFVNNLTNYRWVAPRLVNAPQYDWYVNQPRQIYAKLTFKF
jgi:outer membrane receptor for ferric coprogen and ferric-rhodotorulic acid